MKSKVWWAAAGVLAIGIAASQSGIAQLAGTNQPIVEKNSAGAPMGSSIVGNEWCRVVAERNAATYQKFLAELISMGGDVKGANKVILPGGDGFEWIAVVCGKIQQPQ